MISRFSCFLSILLFISACSYLKSNDDENIIASVGEEHLSLDDLENFKYDNREDSVEKVQRYIESWVKEQLLLQKALDNLGDQQANFERQLKSYKNSLLAYAFEKQLIKQKLDTNISAREYQEYYAQNSVNFKLKEDLYKGVYVHYLLSAPHKDSIQTWLLNTPQIEPLERYCVQFAKGCHTDTTKWITFTKIKELIGSKPINNLYLSLGSNQFSDSTEVFHMNVLEKVETNEIAPLSYVKEQVKSIILNKRKIQLISEVKKEIFEEATLNKRYEIY